MRTFGLVEKNGRLVRETDGDDNPVLARDSGQPQAAEEVETEEVEEETETDGDDSEETETDAEE